MEIFKIQIPLAGSHNESKAYIYNRFKDEEFYLGIKEVEAYMLGKRKIYVHAEYNQDTKDFKINTIALNQNW